MKLLNYTLSYLSVALLGIVGVWAVVFYVNMLDEIYDSIDDGLANSKLLIIQKVQSDTSLVHQDNFRENNYIIREISEQTALSFRDIYQDSTLYMQNEDDQEPVRTLKSAFRGSDNKYYQLLVVSSMVEEDDLIEDLFYAVVWLYLILLASILLINNVLLQRIWKPFYGILQRLQNYKPGEPSVVTDVPTRITEFKKMNETVAGLLERTNVIFASQKQFIENASHELQTPLAISMNRLELLIEKNNLTDEQASEISTIIDSLERLTRLNKTLLLLSRIDNRQFPGEGSVEFYPLGEKLVKSYADLAEFKSIHVSMERAGDFTLTMNEELADIMLSNLLKNGILHNYPGGSVKITITADEVNVENTSKEAPLDPSRIFQRFYKSTEAKNSTGLGLAIVRSIADYYGLVIDYSYDSGSHRFAIRHRRK